MPFAQFSNLCEACRDMFEVQWPKMKLTDASVSQDNLPARPFRSNNNCDFCTLVWAIIQDKGLEFKAETLCTLTVLWGTLEERFQSQVLLIRHQWDYSLPSVGVDFAFIDSGSLTFSLSVVHRVANMARLQ
jgi:hypothetical protein